MAERPFPFLLRVGAVLAIEHARIAKILIAAGEMLLHLARRHAAQLRYEVFPDRAHPAVCGEKLIRDAGPDRVVLKKARRAVRPRFRLSRHISPAGRRRSSVIGNSGCGCSVAGA